MIKSNSTNLNREARQERKVLKRFLATFACLAVKGFNK
jgi:hypothetical protein